MHRFPGDLSGTIKRRTCGWRTHSYNYNLWLDWLKMWVPYKNLYLSEFVQFYFLSMTFHVRISFNCQHSSKALLELKLVRIEFWENSVILKAVLWLYLSGYCRSNTPSHRARAAWCPETPTIKGKKETGIKGRKKIHTVRHIMEQNRGGKRRTWATKKDQKKKVEGGMLWLCCGFCVTVTLQV